MRHSLIVSSAVFTLSYLAARGLLELNLGREMRIAIALLPVIPFAIWILQIARACRELDELELRIHLEALAIAFPIAMVIFMTLGLVELAIGLNPADWSYKHTWIFLPVLYFLGLSLARKRYA